MRDIAATRLYPIGARKRREITREHTNCIYLVHKYSVYIANIKIHSINISR